MDEGFDDGKIGKGEGRSQVGTGGGYPLYPDGMEPAGEAAESQPIGLGFGIEAATSMFREEGEKKGGESWQRLLRNARIFLIRFDFDRWQRSARFVAKRGDDGELGRGAIGEELMLFEDGLFGPAPRSVEFDDVFRAVVGSQAINAVHIAGIGGQAAIGHNVVGRFHRFQDEVGGEGVESAADASGIFFRIDRFQAQISASLWASSSQRRVFVSMSFRTSL